MDGMTIGAVARQAGCKVQTIRWYEEIGLLPPPARSEGGHRVYGKVHAHRLAFIRHARELGFPLDDVRTLLSLADDPGRSCDEADAIARRHLTAIRSRIARLQALETELSRVVEQCGAGRVADCRVIEVLADHTHAHCLANDHSGTGL